jgi:hypothetical protein
MRELTGGEGGAAADIGSGIFILLVDKSSFNGSTSGEGRAVVNISSGAFILLADKLSFNGFNSLPRVYKSREISVLEGSSRLY